MRWTLSLPRLDSALWRLSHFFVLTLWPTLCYLDGICNQENVVVCTVNILRCKRRKKTFTHKRRIECWTIYANARIRILVCWWIRRPINACTPIAWQRQSGRVVLTRANRLSRHGISKDGPSIFAAGRRWRGAAVVVAAAAASDCNAATIERCRASILWCLRKSTRR